MTTNTLNFISIGILLGVSAGFSPGPLLTLIVTQTIRHNRTEGIKVAISPLFTDLPIILITMMIFDRLSQFDVILAIISFAGGIFVAYLGIESVRIKGLEIDIQASKSESLKKGIVTNFLSPNPYLFWATVGVPLIFKAFKINLITAVLFLISFYVLMLSTKIMIAFIVARTKVFINKKKYVVIMRILGVVLLIFSLMFFYDGIKYLH